MTSPRSPDLRKAVSASTASIRFPRLLKSDSASVTFEVTNPRDFFSSATSLNRDAFASASDFTIAAMSLKAVVTVEPSSETALAITSSEPGTTSSTTSSTCAGSATGASSTTSSVAGASTTTSASGTTSTDSTFTFSSVMLSFSFLIVLEVLMPLALSTKNFIMSSLSLSDFSTKPMFCILAPVTGLNAVSSSEIVTNPDSLSQNTFSRIVSVPSPVIVSTPSTFSTDRMFAN